MTFEFYFMVFYRKYRPQTISQLDNQSLRGTLYSVLRGSVPHAFLFTGPKGLGKTSTARIVAKVVNCERKSKVPLRLSEASKSPASTQRLASTLARGEQKSKVGDIEPCNRCNQCLSITNGTNLDVLEIDGASNRGIDEIRDLREKIKLAPLGAAKKVYIIDEVHMLTTEAFNALLKTLEEPPPHVLFMLCTTEPHKVPQTIASRCFHISFTLATQEELLHSFNRIVKEEGIKIDQHALALIAQFSEGSFRDGAKILEEVVALSSGSSITAQLVEERYKVSNINTQLVELLDYMSTRNTLEALKLISILHQQGVDFKFFTEQLIHKLHALLLTQLGVEKAKTEQQHAFSVLEIKQLVESFSKAYGQLRFAVIPQLPLELAIIEWSEQRKTHNNSTTSGQSTETSHKIGSSEQQSTNEPHSEIWPSLIQKMKSQDFSLAGILRGGSLKSYDGKTLVIETPYTFHLKKLTEKKNMDLLKKITAEIVGKNVTIDVVLTKN